MDARNQHDAWMGIISMDRYQPCLPHPLWSFNNPSNNNVKYRICDISHLRYIAYAFCKCWISHMRYLTLQNAYTIYRIRDTFSRTLALGLGSGYSERTINNAYAFLICTSKVCFWFPKWHQKVEPTSWERPISKCKIISIIINHSKSWSTIMYYSKLFNQSRPWSYKVKLTQP